MTVLSCIPVIPSADLPKSLRFWVDALDLNVDREMRRTTTDTRTASACRPRRPDTSNRSEVTPCR